MTKLLRTVILGILFFSCSDKSVNLYDTSNYKDPQLIGSWLPVSSKDDTLTFSKTKYYRCFTNKTGDQYKVSIFEGNWYTTKDSLIIQCRYIAKTYDDSTMSVLRNTVVNDSIPIDYFTYILDTSDSLRINNGIWSSFTRLKM